MGNIIQQKNEEITLINAPIALRTEDESVLLNLAKMYQLYYSIDTVLVHSRFDGVFITLRQETEEVKYHWFEFAIFELVDLVNTLYVEAEGVYRTELERSELINSFDLGVLLESIENWASYFAYGDVDSIDDVNIQLIYKMYECIAHYHKENGEYPAVHSINLNSFIAEVSEYYIKHIQTEGEDQTEEDEEAIPLSSGVPNIPDNNIDTDDDEEEEEVEKEEDEDDGKKIKINLTQRKFVRDGIYKS